MKIPDLKLDKEKYNHPWLPLPHSNRQCEPHQLPMSIQLQAFAWLLWPQGAFCLQPLCEAEESYSFI